MVIKVATDHLTYGDPFTSNSWRSFCVSFAWVLGGSCIFGWVAWVGLGVFGPQNV